MVYECGKQKHDHRKQTVVHGDLGGRRIGSGGSLQYLADHGIEQPAEDDEPYRPSSVARLPDPQKKDQAESDKAQPESEGKELYRVLIHHRHAHLQKKISKAEDHLGYDICKKGQITFHDEVVLFSISRSSEASFDFQHSLKDIDLSKSDKVYLYSRPPS